jgi:hypothetical protein
VQVRPGEFLDPAQGFVAANEVDNETGEILYGITLLSPASPANGSDALVWIDFVALTVGRSEWVLDNAILATRDGASIPVELEMGSVVVGERPSSPPSPTSTTSPTETTRVPAASASSEAPQASPTPTPGVGNTSLTETTPVPAPSASLEAPVASPAPTPGVANTSFPTPESSGTLPVPTDVSPEPPTREVVTTALTVEALGTEQAVHSVAEGEVTATPSPTHWPTLAVPTRAPRARATSEAEKSHVQSALPPILVAAGAVLVFIVGLALYRRRRGEHGR